MGPQNNTQRRYRVNPVELVIFVLVCGGFGFSVYNLFRETEDFKFTALQPMASDATRSVRHTASTATRMPASADTPLYEMEIPCSENPGFNLGHQNCTTDPGRVFRNSPIHNPSETR